MANFNCSCGNQDLEYKSGTGKTGKKWQGWKCTACNIMYGMDGVPWGEKKAPAPKIPTSNSNLGEAKVVKLLSEILKELKIMNGSIPESVNKELQLESEEPF